VSAATYYNFYAVRPSEIYRFNNIIVVDNTHDQLGMPIGSKFVPETTKSDFIKLRISGSEGPSLQSTPERIDINLSQLHQDLFMVVNVD